MTSARRRGPNRTSPISAPSTSSAARALEAAVEAAGKSDAPIDQPAAHAAPRRAGLVDEAPAGDGVGAAASGDQRQRADADIARTDLRGERGRAGRPDQRNAGRGIAAEKLRLHGLAGSQRRFDLGFGIDRFLGGDIEAVAPVESARGVVPLHADAGGEGRRGAGAVGNGAGKAGQIELGHGELPCFVRAISTGPAAAVTRRTASSGAT